MDKCKKREIVHYFSNSNLKTDTDIFNSNKNAYLQPLYVKRRRQLPL